jgi:hypothetical protein
MARNYLGLAALVAAGVGAGAAATWTAVSGPVVVSVDTASFAYSVAIGKDQPWLVGGQVAIICGGRRYSSASGLAAATPGLAPPAPSALIGGAVTVANGTSKLGGYSAVQRTWTAGMCSAITTSIRQYHGGSGVIEFVSEISAKGAKGTATGHGNSAAAGQAPVTEFPSLALPNVLPPPPPPPPPPPFPPPGPPGPPSQVGCSDGSCEGLCTHPAVRGCGASWTGAADLRKPPTGHACGSTKACAAPADVRP